ncbi:ADP-ribosylation factor-like protein-like protein 1 [Mycena belliarum]|uniref:ADP-ribosylation factor n=1 Tax=Mycena belliarum TaxID=1033014 RepID=A0AAD6U5H5_9AGAR|nr:ADP-ribosylation factor-like protein-like protein 1 [Mycena belliae]
MSMGAALSSASGALSSSQTKTFDIVILGLDDAGKTSLINRLKAPGLLVGALPEATPTFAFESESISYGDNHITLWEMGGHEKLRPLWRSFMWKGHAHMFVVDATAPARFAEAKEELDRLLGELRLREHAHPVLVVANKIDAPGAPQLPEISRALDIESLAQGDRLVGLKSTSATSGEGVQEVMDWFVANVSHDQIARHNEYKAEVQANQ